MNALVEDDLGVKRAALESHLVRLQRVVVAYSGGADSALLAACAHEVLGRGAVAVTAVSPSLSARELRAARDLAASRGWAHRLVETNELARAEYARNAPDRCYWCKVELLDVLAPLAEGLQARVAVGTNADDLSDFRPGLRAGRERGVETPLADAGVTKADVRRLSGAMGLPTADKPASPCLASRFAYGVPVTEDRLERIEAAEELIRSLGFGVFRVRDHGDIVRLEVEPDDVPRAAEERERIAHELRRLGWRYVTLDLAGFRSGSMNEVLNPPRFRRP